MNRYVVLCNCFQGQEGRMEGRIVSSLFLLWRDKHRHESRIEGATVGALVIGKVKGGL